MTPATSSSDELALMTAVVDLAQDAILVIDAEQHIQRFNAAAEDIFGYAASEALGQLVSVLIPNRFQASHAEHVRRFAASQQGRRHMGRERLIMG
ncbi:MAG: PAS domain S-box protein, partial [Thermoflexales bacterium]|nr:PAS domain S-box protein [Thermoflexales bacterium]